MRSSFIEFIWCSGMHKWFIGGGGGCWMRTLSGRFCAYFVVSGGFGVFVTMVIGFCDCVSMGWGFYCVVCVGGSLLGLLHFLGIIDTSYINFY